MSLCCRSFRLDSVLLWTATGLALTNPAHSQGVVRDRLRESGTIVPQSVIPSKFQGHWSVDLRACGAAPADDSQVWITATSLNFYETNGHALKVVLADGNHAVVTLRSEGEGMTFVAKKGLVLSSEGTLTIRNEDDTGSTSFKRCSDKEAAPTFMPHHTMPPR